MPPREALERLPPSNLIGGGWSRQVPPREALERLPSIKFDRGRGVGECPQGGV